MAGFISVAFISNSYLNGDGIEHCNRQASEKPRFYWVFDGRRLQSEKGFCNLQFLHRRTRRFVGGIISPNIISKPPSARANLMFAGKSGVFQQYCQKKDARISLQILAMRSGREFFLVKGLRESPMLIY